jgi:hypothetical protein
MLICRDIGTLTTFYHITRQAGPSTGSGLFSSTSANRDPHNFDAVLGRSRCNGLSTLFAAEPHHRSSRTHSASHEADPCEKAGTYCNRFPGKYRRGRSAVRTASHRSRNTDRLPRVRRDNCLPPLSLQPSRFRIHSSSLPLGWASVLTISESVGIPRI